MKLLSCGPILLAIAFSATAAADQTTIPTYDAARDIFWSQVYQDKLDGRPYSDLNCGFEFRSKQDIVMQVEHAFPANWFGTALGCSSRANCQATSERFNRIEADLHNLWPADKDANQLRSNHSLAIIAGENSEFLDCDMEKAASEFDDTPTAWVIEPRPISRGNLARSIFYMFYEYDLPIEARLVPLLKAWNRSDRVSADECRRNDPIEAIQGTRNPFIDDPASVNEYW